MSDQIARRTNGTAAVTAESALVAGDLSTMTTEERLAYYSRVCESLGLNPYTRPFDFLQLSGRTVLYARRDCTDQLRTLRSVSITSVETVVDNDLCMVTVRARTPDGREDMDIGAVATAGLRGEALANARMKALTKAKRRVTLSICGLGLMDESEVETIAPTDPAPLPANELRIEAPVVVTEAPARTRNEAFQDLTRTPGWFIADRDWHAAKSFVEELLGHKIGMLKDLTVDEIDRARDELLSRAAEKALAAPPAEEDDPFEPAAFVELTEQIRSAQAAGR